MFGFQNAEIFIIIFKMTEKAQVFLVDREEKYTMPM